MTKPTTQEATRRTRWRRALLLAAGMALASIVPLPRPEEPLFGPYGPDKLLHVLGHAALAGAIAEALSPERRRTAYPAAAGGLLSAGHGLVVESLQERLPGRSAEPADRWAAAVGGAAGAVAWALFGHR